MVPYLCRQGTLCPFHPSRCLERPEIYRLYQRRLHYVGDWHTHPEPFPLPSQDDFLSIQDILRRSRHPYTGIILAIVGRSSAVRGLYVGIAD
ncbi:Mov34/MPN/PAD-1 family protein [Terrihabitans sp. B22-R8]|uniref:Mov34/MPN/PAD-1 family protein n=1 Tax=Terrihabitans sp. B22-R8 TaxID=3425128 RepID=UPI00403C4CC7